MSRKKRARAKKTNITNNREHPNPTPKTQELPKHSPETEKQQRTTRKSLKQSLAGGIALSLAVIGIQSISGKSPSTNNTPAQTANSAGKNPNSSSSLLIAKNQTGKSTEAIPEGIEKTIEILKKNLEPNHPIPLNEQMFTTLFDQLKTDPAFIKIATESARPGEHVVFNPRMLSNLLNPILLSVSPTYYLDPDPAENTLTLFTVRRPKNYRSVIDIPGQLQVNHEIWSVETSEQYQGGPGGGVIPGVNAVFIKTGTGYGPVSSERHLFQFLQQQQQSELYELDKVTPEDRKNVMLNHESLHIWLAKQFSWSENTASTPYHTSTFILADGSEVTLNVPIQRIQINEALACSITNSSQNIDDNTCISSTTGNLSASTPTYGFYKYLFWQTAAAIGMLPTSDEPLSENDFHQKMSQILENAGAAGLRTINEHIAKTLLATLPAKNPSNLKSFLPDSNTTTPRSAPTGH